MISLERIKELQADHAGIKHGEIADLLTAAEALEKLKECARKTSMSLSFGSTNEFWIGNLDRKSQWKTNATLESAISEFHKNIFEK